MPSLRVFEFGKEGVLNKVDKVELALKLYKKHFNDGHPVKTIQTLFNRVRLFLLCSSSLRVFQHIHSSPVPVAHTRDKNQNGDFSIRGALMRCMS